MKPITGRLALTAACALLLGRMAGDAKHSKETVFFKLRCSTKTGSPRAGAGVVRSWNVLKRFEDVRVLSVLAALTMPCRRPPRALPH